MATSPNDETASSNPLGAFVDAHRVEIKHRGKRFNAGEHAWLGSTGAERARTALFKNRLIDVPARVFDSIDRLDGKETLQYGEIVALSGDFYRDPGELFDERSTLVDVPFKANDLDDLRELIDKELAWIDARREGTAGESYPGTDVKLAWNSKSYLELALDNTAHFRWHNMVAYCKYHAEALSLAQSLRGREGETFRRALYTNAFADHFLTDGFAAGHIRVPRAEIRAWAEKTGLSEKTAGALSKLLHDQDGHVDVHSLHGETDETERPEDDGLKVSNAAGHEWHTYCDGQLFLQTDTGKQAVEEAVSAVAASVTEFMLAWQVGEMPEDMYEATRFVPFPHATTQSLVLKFPADLPVADLDALFEGITWYIKFAGLEKFHLRRLFVALPELMEQFRANIAIAAKDPELRKRVAPAYIEAYKQIA